MNWFYVDNGQQAGPVMDEQLDELVRNNKVGGDTLVWREGQANWMPYREARPEGVQPPAPPQILTPVAGEIVCAECMRGFHRSDVVQYGDRWVCRNCQPGFVQRLQQGASPP